MVRPFGGVGATVFGGTGVSSNYTGFGAGGGVDFASHPFAFGLRADLSYLGAGQNQWVQVYTLDLRVFLAAEKWRWRPYVEGGIGGGGALHLAGSPGYAVGAGGGVVYEAPQGPAVFLDMRNITLGNMESSGPTMFMIRFGFMK